MLKSRLLRLHAPLAHFAPSVSFSCNTYCEQMLMNIQAVNLNKLTLLTKYQNLGNYSSPSSICDLIALSRLAWKFSIREKVTVLVPRVISVARYV